MIKLFDNLTATASAELDTRQCRDVLLLHEVAGGETGGHCTLRDRVCTPSSAAGAAIVSAEREEGEVTVLTAAAHGLLAGQRVRIRGVEADEATEFNGDFVVATVPDADVFTVAQEGLDDLGAGGSACRLVETDHRAEEDGGGVNLPAADSLASYTCTVHDCADYLVVTCHVTDGAHTVYARLLPAR